LPEYFLRGAEAEYLTTILKVTTNKGSLILANTEEPERFSEERRWY